jgi:hypothetical protein
MCCTTILLHLGTKKILKYRQKNNLAQIFACTNQASEKIFCRNNVFKCNTFMKYLDGLMQGFSFPDLGPFSHLLIDSQVSRLKMRTN